MDYALILKSALILFAIINPVGSIPIFVQLTQGMKPAEKRRTFDTAVWVSLIILFVFILAGKAILMYFFQIELCDLMAAGGLLLVIIAIDHLVFGSLVRGVTSGSRPDGRHLGAVPMACPILAGPGAMMTIFVIYSENGFLIAASAIVIVMTLTWLMLKFLEKIYSFLGELVCLVLSKILCLFITAIGIRLLMQGLLHYFK